MKIKMMIAASAMVLATGAFAQMTDGTGSTPSATGPGPEQSTSQQRDSGGMSPPSATSPNGNLSGGGNDAAAMGSGTSSASDMQMRDGRWMMGDRAATKQEISDHKKMMKSMHSKPM